MRISIDHEEKMLLFWLTHEESSHPDCNEIINEIAAQYCPEQTYRTIVFQSGQGDYVENTKALLRHNI